MKKGSYWRLECFKYLNLSFQLTKMQQTKAKLFFCLVSGLMSQLTAMVMSRWSVNLTILFLDKLRLSDTFIILSFKL